jgi:hypothetical protein
MPNKKKDTSSSLLLGLIPSHLRTPEQIARWNIRDESPTYMLLRKPTSLEELNKNEYYHQIAIWRDNGALTYVSPGNCIESPREGERYLSLRFGGGGPKLYIVGNRDRDVAQTAAFFIKLEQPTYESSSLTIGTPGCFFDFRAAPARCFERLLEINPFRMFNFYGLTLNVEQSIVIAKSPYVMNVRFSDCSFEDQACGFIDAMQSRNSSSDVLLFEESTGLSDDNLKRLLQLDTMEQLALPCLNKEIAMLPFSAKVNHLDYEISSSSLQEDLLPSMDIVTSELAITIQLGSETNLSENVIAFFRRMAEFTHLVELKILFRFKYGYPGLQESLPEGIVQEIVRVALVNNNLVLLDLSDGGRHIDWAPHMETLCNGLRAHKGLRTLKVTVYDDNSSFGPEFTFLRELLTENRNLTTTNENGLFYWGYWQTRNIMKKIYSLNKFYRGSAGLAVEPTKERATLVATALLHRASNNFQRSALLLSDHVDVLYDLIPLARFDDEIHADNYDSRPTGYSMRKRRRST